MFTRFPDRLLNRSVFVVGSFFDPWADAREGWRAPVFAMVGLEPGQKIGPEFTYNAALLDVSGRVRSTWSLGVRRELRQSQGALQPWEGALGGFEVLEGKSLQAIRQQLQRRDSQGPRDAFAAVCAAMDAQGGESWDAFLSALERDRFTASTWFERDRAHVCLRDEALDCEVFNLWDEEVVAAIDDGFLKAPRVPRPADEDWLPHLVEYAQELGLVRSLRAEKPHQGQRERQRS